MRTNATRYVVLGLLTDGPLSGYEIKKLVDLRFRYFWSESYGQIYPELKKLTAEGLVCRLPDKDGEGGRPKKRYEITDAGKESFASWMAEAPEAERQRNEFLLKIFWAPWVSTSRMVEYVKDFRNRHNRDLEMLRRMESELLGILSTHDNHWWILQAARLGRRVNEAYVAWAAELVANMEGMGDADGK